MTEISGYITMLLAESCLLAEHSRIIVVSGMFKGGQVVHLLPMYMASQEVLSNMGWTVDFQKSCENGMYEYRTILHIQTMLVDYTILHLNIIRL